MCSLKLLLYPHGDTAARDLSSMTWWFDGPMTVTIHYVYA